MIASTKRLEVGDFLKCADADEMIAYMEQLAKVGIETDFCNHRNGVDGLWLEVIAVNDVTTEENKKLLEAMNLLYKYCDNRTSCKCCQFGYGRYHCFFSGENPSRWGYNKAFEED